MRKTKMTLILAGVACICAVLVAPALAFTEFRAKSVPTTVKDINKGIHKFSVPGALVPVECTTAKSEGKVTKTKASTQQDTVEYSGCTAFGFSASVSNAEYLFFASGTVNQLNEVKIKVPLGGCEVIVKPANNKTLKEITYTNVPSKNKEVEVKANVSGITEESTGSTCGTSGKEAKYVGTSIVSDAGVDLEVV